VNPAGLPEVIQRALDEGRGTVAPQEAFDVLGCGKTAGFAAIKRGGIRVVRIGRLVRVPIPVLLQMLGVEGVKPNGRSTVNAGVSGKGLH
jgi:hypothetical protein